MTSMMRSTTADTTWEQEATRARLYWVGTLASTWDWEAVGDTTQRYIDFSPDTITIACSIHLTQSLAPESSSPVDSKPLSFPLLIIFCLVVYAFLLSIFNCL